MTAWVTSPPDAARYFSTDTTTGARTWLWDGSAWSPDGSSQTAPVTVGSQGMGPSLGVTSDGSLTLVRRGTTVTATLVSGIPVDTSSHSTGTVPLGFRPVAGGAYVGPLFGDATAGPEGKFGASGSSWLIWWTGGASSSVGARVEWETEDPWP